MDHFPPISRLFSKQKVFAYYGFLGDRNFGDELVFEAAKALFEPGVVLPIRRRMPLHLGAAAKFCKKLFDGILIGGGTLVGPSFYYQGFYAELLSRGNPIFLHGTGIHKPSTWNNTWKDFLDNKVYGGVRGPLSIENLSSIKRDFLIAGDAAFALFKPQTVRQPRDDQKTVLINGGAHDPFPGMEKSRESIEQFASGLLQTGFEVHFMPCHEIDLEWGRELQQRHPQIKLLPVPLGFDAAQKLFREATFAVGERLHFTAMAILTGCPFLSVNYSTKHDDLLASVELAQAGIAPTQITPSSIQSIFADRGSFDWDRVFHHIESYKAFQTAEMKAFRLNERA